MKWIASIAAFGSLAVSSQALAADAIADTARGKQLYQYWCATCHAPDPREGGRLLPGTASLEVKYKGTKPADLEKRDDLVEPYTSFVIRHGSEGMPSFRKTEISDRDMADIAAYLNHK
jgi:mono/diheme cytochrome c family protein